MLSRSSWMPTFPSIVVLEHAVFERPDVENIGIERVNDQCTGAEVRKA